jgi:hypothetical protein
MARRRQPEVPAVNGGLSRRQFLQAAGLGAAAIAESGCTGTCRSISRDRGTAQARIWAMGRMLGREKIKCMA